MKGVFFNFKLKKEQLFKLQPEKANSNRKGLHSLKLTPKILHPLNELHLFKGGIAHLHHTQVTVFKNTFRKNIIGQM